MMAISVARPNLDRPGPALTSISSVTMTALITAQRCYARLFRRRGSKHRTRGQAFCPLRPAFREQPDLIAILGDQKAVGGLSTFITTADKSRIGARCLRVRACQTVRHAR